VCRSFLIDKVGVEGIMARAPKAYLKAFVASWIASKFVYESGLDGNESYTFYRYMKKLEADADRRSRL